MTRRCVSCATMRSILGAECTHDAFLGGQLHLWQPKTGYRAGVDPVLLAASVPAKPGQSVLDLGCGVGAAALCLGARVPDLTLLGVERQSDYAALAGQNGLEVVLADVSELPTEIRQMSFDHVICNPPYFDRTAGHSAQDAGREVARGEETTVAEWIDAAARRLKPKGYLHVIHRVEKLPALLAAADHLGSIEVLPLAARAGRAADRVILRARKEGRAPFQLHAPLILHEGPEHVRDGEDYAAPVAAVLRDGAALVW